MANFTSVSISPPKDWQAFERDARVLFELILGDPQTQNNGRAGQPQHGVDIYGRRGGAGGPLVGVQCKGKDVDYGGRVSRAELRGEVKKSEKFEPSISEFILITTAPDDAEIQREARVLERELHSTGRNISIAVWGWGHLQQEIGRHAEAIRIFHPDGSPFTDKLLAQGAKIATQIAKEAEKTTRIEDLFTRVLSALPQLQIAYADNRPIDDELNRHLHDQIDSYRDLIMQGRPRTALTLLSALRAKLPTTATDKVRYRVYGNIGVCHHKLGELKVAAATFLEAAELDKDDDPICASNKIVALLLLERREEAYKLSVQTNNKYSSNADVAIQRLQARRKTEDLEGIFRSFPASVAREPRVALVYLTILRMEGRSEWTLGLQQALLDNPDFLPLRLMRGETVLESVLGKDRVALGAGGPEIPTLEDVSAAADAFQTAWAKSISDETPAPFAAAHNAALAFMVLGDVNRAGEILDEALKKGYDAEESIRFRVSILRRQSRDRDAILLADTLPASPTNAIYQADLRSVTDPKTARSILLDRERYSDRADVVAAAAIYTESLLHEGDAPAALAEALRLHGLLAEDPHTWLLLHSAHLALGEASAASDLDQAIRLLKDTSDFGARFMVSDALVKAGRYDDAVDLLKGRVTTEYDGPALRVLIVAAANADRRPVLADLLRDLPSRLRETPFYRRAKAALAIQSGDIRGAEQTLREYLVLQPRDLEMHLQFLHVLLTLEKIDEIRDQVIRSPTDFDGPPQDFLHLSHFIQKFGDWRDGLKLAYRTLLHNEGNAAVNIRYVGFFFDFGQRMDLAVASNTVEVDMAICLQHAEGITEVYILEPNSDLRTTVRHLSPTHGLARSLLGQKVSSAVTLPDESIATIEWIKPKEVHALHQVLHRFQNLFPEAGGLERVNVQPQSPDALQPILDRVQARHEVFKSAFDSYSSGRVPISLLARSLARRRSCGRVFRTGPGWPPTFRLRG